MEPVKNNRLKAFFIISLVIFNLLFFAKDFLILSYFRMADVYANCPEETLNCDPGSYTYADDIVIGLFTISIFAAAVSASILINRQIEKLWKKHHQARGPQPRPRRRP